MRPEVVAFRELDALVRKLTEQLAVFRRRAMTAESRVRELELMLASAHDATTSAQAELVRAQDELAETRIAERKALTAIDRARADARVAVASVVASAPATDADLIRANAELRTLLQEARDRTTALMERVRFLRQQLGHGAEK